MSLTGGLQTHPETCATKLLRMSCVARFAKEKQDEEGSWSYCAGRDFGWLRNKRDSKHPDGRGGVDDRPDCFCRECPVMEQEVKWAVNWLIAVIGTDRQYKAEGDLLELVRAYAP